MKDLTERARSRLEAYLEAVRAAVSADAGTDTDEVVWDIRRHIEDELSVEAGSGAATLADLEAVLERLGDPAGWAGDGPRSAGGRDVAGREASADEASAAGGSARLGGWWRDPAPAAVAILTLAAAGTWALGWPAVALVLLGAAYVLGRWRLATGDSLEGAGRWLAYPALLVGAAMLALVVLWWPVLVSPLVFATGGLLDELRRRGSSLPAPGSPGQVSLVAAWLPVAGGVWWLLAGALAARRPDLVRRAFHPFTGWFRRRHGLFLCVAGVVLVLIGLYRMA